jgi:DNA ligase 1
MKAFAALLDRLIYTRSRNAKIDLIVSYLKATPDPERGWALAALTEALDFPFVTSSVVRKLAVSRIDPELFALSRQYVGETAETVALLWTGVGPKADLASLSLSAVVARLGNTTRASAPQVLTHLLDEIDSDQRYALLKLALGGMRLGVSARLVKIAFAAAFSVSVDDVDELWHALSPPYDRLFSWASGQSPRPDLSTTAFFRPFMLAHPLEDRIPDLSAYAVEWKWDGIRVQVARAAGQTRIFSRGGEEISLAFPDIIDALPADMVLDGELLVRDAALSPDNLLSGVGSFNALQQRLGRKTVSKKQLSDAPAFVRVYDILQLGPTDLRGQPWHARRQILETVVSELTPDRFDLSPLVEAQDFEELLHLRDNAPDPTIEGLMLKDRMSVYEAGRKAGLWYKCKRNPLTVDCVLMYAQRGNGKRASFYSDYTFGCWDPSGELLPVGKAYSGFTDQELKWLDQFVRQNTIGRFGPVREVTKTLVLEVAFDSVQTSKRHKSGLAMRFPRISRIRKDKPATEADLIETLAKMASLTQPTSG